VITNNQNMPSSTITIPSRTERLNDVRQFVAQAARLHGFRDDDVNNIMLAVDEACTNIIKHAYNYSPDESIEVNVGMKGGEFEILIADRGKNFNPNSVPPPNMKEYMTQYRRGGLGLYLMKKVMDSVDFQFHANRNILRMTKLLH
jgi:serine/threonine-protein kinase RsbW